MTPGEMIRAARQRRGLSQARLARRTGTRQSAISRLENDEVSPTIETLRLMLNALGEDLDLEARSLVNSQDPLHEGEWMSLSPEERLRRASSWNRLAGKLVVAGREAKGVAMADRPAPPLEAERILTTLAERGVDFVVIGGVAAQTHGRMRMTADVDLIPAADPANLDRLAGALRSLEARILNRGSDDAEITAALLPRATIWQFATPVGGIYVMHEVPDGRPFKDLRDAALRIQLEGQEIRIVSLDDLIAMKLARARPVDLEDVAVLTAAER